MVHCVGQGEGGTVEEGPTERSSELVWIDLEPIVGQGGGVDLRGRSGPQPPPKYRPGGPAIKVDGAVFTVRVVEADGLFMSQNIDLESANVMYIAVGDQRVVVPDHFVSRAGRPHLSAAVAVVPSTSGLLCVDLEESLTASEEILVLIQASDKKPSYRIVAERADQVIVQSAVSAWRGPDALVRLRRGDAIRVEGRLWNGRRWSRTIQWSADELRHYPTSERLVAPPAVAAPVCVPGELEAIQQQSLREQVETAAITYLQPLTAELSNLESDPASAEVMKRIDDLLVQASACASSMGWTDEQKHALRVAAAASNFVRQSLATAEVFGYEIATTKASFSGMLFAAIDTLAEAIGRNSLAAAPAP